MSNEVLGTVLGLGIPYYQVKYAWYRWGDLRDLRRAQLTYMTV